MNYSFDCYFFIEKNNLRSRPYCDKLQQEIRPKNCFNCGWYKKSLDGMVELDPNIVMKIKNYPRKSLGLEEL